METLLIQLNQFLGEATRATYAGDGKRVPSQRPGFKELEYRDDPFYYRDSYSGFFTSAGEEVVWYKDQVLWMQSYGGGMVPKHRNDDKFAHETFSFLKTALSAGDKTTVFQPRGPQELIRDDWKYLTEWSGDITEFSGREQIFHKNNPVFYHNFFGGIIKSRG